MLDRGAERQGKDTDHNSPLHRTCKTGYLDIVQHLLDRGADTRAKTRDSKWTLLHEACSHDKFSVVKVLLNHDAAVEATAANEMTPLLTACTAGRLKIARLLSFFGCSFDQHGR